ncbi:hypothetical protein QSE00_06260 [Arenibacter sp. M-2]|uniref:hypothetical protein n=1 Tax=Arenibacter sp. M-2 TaxID=3053612 RepID=UPI002570CE8C|nr:hypothetical protein [Arenibacter sp. M-2]MDL5511407.1 hypothetical protein [Arenibacter sp. M-2]|tara:strand:- start:10613 stop:11944 length:1332 start_codon:yes stop_codon:yes gene_type:complete
MKTTIYILLFTLLLSSCKKDDSEHTNIAPEAFNLLTVENQAENVSLIPVFTWQAATDPDGDSVVYDLYLEVLTGGFLVPKLNANQQPPDPTLIIAQGITETSYTLTDPLSINSSFTWKVVARDNQGGTVESDIFSFETRPLNTSEEAFVASTPFDVREGHGSVFFKDKFWVIGGFANIEDVKNDVWSSADGITWVQETAEAGFTGRGQFGITVFKDKIFIYGGLGGGNLLSDVWSSIDGVNWIQETADTGFSPRGQTKLLSYNDKLYAIGGLDNPLDPTTGSTEEIWSSNNGADWVQETNAAPYLARYGFEALVFDNKMFVIGGALSTTFEIQNDVWYSKDGKNWTQIVHPGSSYPKRLLFKSTVFNEKIWITSGFFEDEIEEFHYNDFWSSSDGVYWKKEVSNAGYEPRFSSTLISNQNFMLLIGGGEISTNAKFNDVWKYD